MKALKKIGKALWAIWHNAFPEPSLAVEEFCRALRLYPEMFFMDLRKAADGTLEVLIRLEQRPSTAHWNIAKYTLILGPVYMAFQADNQAESTMLNRTEVKMLTAAVGDWINNDPKMKGD